MNVSEFFNNPYKQVPNPQYKGKRDKKHPPTIPVRKTQNNTPDVYRDMANSIDDAGAIFNNFSKKELYKYNDYDVTISRTNLDSLDKEVAEHQSNWTKFGNSMVQTVVGELILGTAISITDVGGLMIDAITGRAFKDDYDFSNPLSDALESWKKGIEEDVAPVHLDPDVNIANGGLTTPGWYFSNFPSLISTLTLLIPTKLVSKGIGLAAKGVKTIGKTRRAAKLAKAIKEGDEIADASKLVADAGKAKSLNAFQEWWYNPITRIRAKEGAKLLGEAAIMRTMENYQEAGQTYSDMYAQVLTELNKMKDEDYKDFVTRNANTLKDVDTSDKEAVAKTIANSAANRTFLIDYSNIVFDVIQLHGLGRIGKLSKKTRSYSVARAQRASIQTAASTTEEAMAAAPKGFTRGRQLAWDWIKGTGKTTIEESTEGIEEAVNYIAQQEGMTYGKSMLKRDVDASFSGFWNSRIHDYMADPAMWESAVWGVAGGVIFGIGGKAYKRYEIAKQNKELAKKRAENAETKESISVEDWITRSEMPEIAAAIESINSRRGHMSELQRKLELIKDRKDPYTTDPETKENKEFDGNVKIRQMIARERAIKEYRQQLAIEAINSGTYDALIEYMKAEPVRQAMVKANIIDETGSKEFIADTVRDLEQTKELYHKELSTIQYQISALNKANKGRVDIPFEYIQSIACSNVKFRLNMQAADNVLANLEQQLMQQGVNQAEHQDILRTIRLTRLQDLWGRLEAEKKQLKEGKVTDREGNPLTRWRAAESIMDIQRQQTAILNQINSDEMSVWSEEDKVLNENGDNVNVVSRKLATMLDTIRRGSSYLKDGNDFFINTSDENFLKTDEELIKAFNEWFDSKAMKRNNLSVQTIANLAKQSEEKRKAVAKKVSDLKNTNSQVYDLYEAITATQIERAANQANIISSQTEIRDKVDELHNRTSKVREEIIEDCEDVILDIQNKYADKVEHGVEKVIIQAFVNNREEAYRLARQYFTEKDNEGHSDAEKFINALRILNYSSGSNRQLFQYMSFVLQANEQKRKKINESKPNTPTNAAPPPQQPTEEEVSQPVIQNPSQSSQTEQPINPSPQQQQSSDEPVNSQNDEMQMKDYQSKNSKVYRISIDADGKLYTEASSLSSSSATPMDVRMIKYGDNTYVLDPDQLLHLIHSEAFDGVPSNYLNVGINSTVTLRPVVEINQDGSIKVVKKGSISTYYSDADSTEKEQIEEQAKNNNIEQHKELIQTVGESTTVDVTTPVGESSEEIAAPTIELPFSTQPSSGSADISNIFDGLDAMNGTTSEESSEETPEQTSETPAGEEQQQNSPTGEVENQQQITDETPVTDETQTGGVSEQDKLISDLAASSLDWSTEGVEEVKEHKEQIAQTVADALNAPIESVTNAVDDIFAGLDDAVQHTESLGKTDDVNKAAGKTVFLSRFEDPALPNLGNAFKTSIEELVENYANLLLVSEVTTNGITKKVICLSNLVSICATVNGSAEPALVEHLRGLFLSYFNTTEAKAKYQVIDYDVNSQDILDNLSSVGTDNASQFNSTAIVAQRIDLNSAIDQAERNEEIDAVLRSLEKGDELIAEKSEKRIEFIAKKRVKVNGIFKECVAVVGEQRIPQIDSRSRYYVYNKGFRVDVGLNANGRLVSNFKHFVEDVFFNPTKYQGMRTQILNFIAATNANDRNAALNAFAADADVKALVSNSIQAPVGENLIFVLRDANGQPVQNPVNYWNLITFLSDLYRGAIENNVGTDAASVEKYARASIDNWFYKVYNSYDAVVKQPDSVTVKIEGVNEGQCIRLYTVPGEASRNYQNLPLAHEAIENMNNARFAINNPVTGMTIANPIDGEVSRKSVSKNFRKFIALYSKNAEPEYIECFPAFLSDTQIRQNGSLLQLIGSAVTQRAVEVFDELNDSATDDNFNKVVDLLRDIIVAYPAKNSNLQNRDTIPLFTGISSNFSINVVNRQNSYKYVEVVFYNGNTYETFKIYQRGQFNNYTFGYEFNDGVTRKRAFRKQDNKNVITTNAAYGFMTWVINRCQINLDSVAIDDDAKIAKGINVTRNEGFVKRDNEGKLRIHIPNRKGDFDETFDSYTNFMLNSGMLRVNLAKDDKGHNFATRGPKLRAYKYMYVGQPVPTTTQQTDTSSDIYRTADGKTVVKNYVRKTTDKEKFNKAKDLLKQIADTRRAGNPTVGLIRELFNVIGKGNVYDRIEQLCDELGIDVPLVPDAIFYNDELNTIEVDKNKNVKLYNKPQAAANPNDNTDRTYRVRRNGKSVTQRLAKGWTMVGADWLNRLASNDANEQNSAIRTLMHERLHHIIHALPVDDRGKMLKSIKEIYDVALARVNEELVKRPDNKSLQYIYAVLTAPKKEETQLEEFLVEATTSETFFKFLNNIEWKEEVKQSKKKSLFDKIMELIAKLFSWGDITKNSAYDKLINTLREFGNNESGDVITEEVVDNDGSTTDSGITIDEKEIDITTPVTEDVTQGISSQDLNAPVTVDFDGEDIDVNAITDVFDNLFDMYAEPTISDYDDNDVVPNDTAIQSLDDIRRILDVDQVENFNTLINNGIMNYKCS